MAFFKFATGDTLPVLIENNIFKEGKNLRFYVSKAAENVTVESLLTLLQNKNALKSFEVYNDDNKVLEVYAGYTDLVNFAVTTDSYEIVLTRPNDDVTIKELSEKVSTLAVTADKLVDLTKQVNTIDSNSKNLSTKVDTLEDTTKTVEQNSFDITDLQVALADIYETINAKTAASATNSTVTTTTTDSAAAPATSTTTAAPANNTTTTAATATGGVING